MADIKNHSTLTTGLVSYWDLEEASGTRYDLHGSNNLTDNNTVTSRAGQIGNGASIDDATSESLTVASSSTFVYSGASARSISLWFYADDLSGTNTIASCWGATGAAQNWIVFASGTTLYAGVEQAATLISGGTISAATWYHVVLLLKADGSAELYLNNVSKGTGTPSASAGSDAEFALGKNGATNYFDGAVDEVGWWTKELTSTEITDLYNSGNGLPYYELDSTDVITWHDMQDATDLAGNYNQSVTNATFSSANTLSGNFANSLSFDGTGDYSVLGDIVELDSASAFTVAWWMYMDTVVANMLWASSDIGVADSHQAFIQNASGPLRMAVKSVNNRGDYTGLTTATWYHCVLAFDGTASGNSGRLKFYLNGTHVPLTYTGTIEATASTGDNWYLGMREGGSDVYDLEGELQQFIIFDRAITGYEVQQLYNSGSGNTYSSFFPSSSTFKPIVTSFM